MMLKAVIVEDEDLLREGLIRCVPWEELGYEVVGEADNGKEALSLILKMTPDIVITDIRMPLVDGIQMSEQIKNDNPDIKIIIISGYDEFEYARRAMKAGVSEYILKPLRMDQLKEVLRNVRGTCLAEKKKKAALKKMIAAHEFYDESLRNNIYTEILLKDYEGLYEKAAKLLGPEIYDEYYAVGICELSSFAMLTADCDYLEILRLDREFEENLRKAVLNQEVEMVRLNNCERLLCISGSTSQAVNEKTAMLQNQVNKHDELEHVELVFGNIAKGPQGLKNSFIIAKSAKERQYLQSWSHTNSLESGADINIKYMHYNAENLFFEIRCGNTYSINAELEKFEEELKKEKIISHIHVILIISNLYFSLIKIPEEFGEDVRAVIGDPMKCYHSMIGKSKRKQVLEELQIICHKINAHLESVQGNRKQGVIKRIVNYIQQEYANEKLTMKDVADHAFISVSYFGFILKKETGKTFIEYLTEVRMEQAKFYLTETNMKTYEVAQACGYSNSTYFSTVFKSFYGVSPTAYRKEKEA